MDPVHLGFGCCDFQLQASNGDVVCGRSMEFPFGQQSQVVTYNRGEQFASTAPDGSKGLEWTSKYGFTGISPFHLDTPDEGMNEAGLSFGVLTLDDTEYQSVSGGQEEHALAMLDVSKWILGSFATVEEVKAAIQNVRIWGQFVGPMQSIPKLHISLHDSKGNNGVIELIKGETKFYDNPNGVLTNDPQLPWHLENLNNFKHLSPEPAGPDVRDLEKGMLGLPGDWSSESRFVRLSVERLYADPETGEQAFLKATHMLNSVDIPYGVVQGTFHNLKFTATTLWASIKDLTNRKFYFRPANDMTWRVIDLSILPFAPGTAHPKLNVQVKGPTTIDITNQLYQTRHWGLNALLGAPHPLINVSQSENSPAVKSVAAVISEKAALAVATDIHLIADMPEAAVISEAVNNAVDSLPLAATTEGN